MSRRRNTRGRDVDGRNTPLQQRRAVVRGPQLELPKQPQSRNAHERARGGAFVVSIRLTDSTSKLLDALVVKRGREVTRGSFYRRTYTRSEFITDVIRQLAKSEGVS